MKNRLILWTMLLLVAACSTPVAENDSESTPAASDIPATENGPESTGKHVYQEQDTGVYWPTEGWRTARPEEVGMDSQKLAQAIEYASDPRFKTDAVLIVKNGYIVAEAYLGEFEQDTPHVSHSMAKGFTSALIGIAIDKGLIPGIDARLCQYFDQWASADDVRSKICIRHALTLTTGLMWHEDWENFDPDTNDAMQMIYSEEYLGYMLSREAIHEPGKFFTYSTGDPMLMSGVIAKATGMSALEFAQGNLFQPLGISSVRWDSDRQGYTATFAMLYLTVRDYAKFGYLYLHKGRWEDEQIVSEAWVDASTRTDPSVNMWDAYGYLWHVNLPLRLGAPNSNIPADGYMAEGILGQNIIIIPSRDLVIVKVANEQDERIDLVRFLTLVLDAVEALQ